MWAIFASKAKDLTEIYQEKWQVGVNMHIWIYIMISLVNSKIIYILLHTILGNLYLTTLYIFWKNKIKVEKNINHTAIKGSALQQTDIWTFQESVIKTTVVDRKDNIQRLIFREVHPLGNCRALEDMFQRYSNFLTSELQHLYNIQCGM